MVVYRRLNGHEFEQALGAGDGQRSLACCSAWGHKESDTTEQLNKACACLGEVREKAISRKNKSIPQAQGIYRGYKNHKDFPCGAVDRNPPANAGDTGLIPGPGRFHMPRSN